MPGAISSRTARATIQLPDQRSSVPRRTSQAVKRMSGRLSTACYVRPMPVTQAAGHAIAYEWVGEESGKPPLVFLHEGLGSIRQWRDFPAKVAAASGGRRLPHDRYGYGQSDVLAQEKRNRRFMHDEGLAALPELLKNVAVERP